MALYFVLIVLLHLPPVQTFLGHEVSQALEQKFGTKVKVGHVNLGFLNRIIVDDLMMYDQQGDSLLYASRVSVKADYLPLMSGKISISSAQIFGLKANLYKQTAQSKPNFQFVLDSLASKDTTQHKPLDLHIGSLIIRRGSVAYNQQDVASRLGVFSPAHIHVNEISSHIILNHATDNSIDLLVKKLALKDQSGFQLKSLHFKLVANKRQATLKEFCLLLPHSELNLGNVKAQYNFYNGKLVPGSLSYEGAINQSKITLSDIACFVPMLRKFDETLYVNSRFSGTSTSVVCPSLSMRTGSGNLNLQARGRVNDLDQKRPRWSVDIDNLNLAAQGIKNVAANLGQKVKVPQEILRLGTIHFAGHLKGYTNELAAQGHLDTDAGSVKFSAAKKGELLKANVDTRGIQLGRILDNKQLGLLAATVGIQGTKQHLQAKGTILRFDYNKYAFRNILLDGLYDHNKVSGTASIADPNVNLKIQGVYLLKGGKYDLTAIVNHLKPNIVGIKMADRNYVLHNLMVSANNKSRESHLDVEAPFMSLYARGQYDLADLYGSLVNIVADKLPTLPGISRHATKGVNDFTLQANINSTEILDRMFGIPLKLDAPLHINGNVSTIDKDVNLYVSAPSFSYNGSAFHDVSVELNTLGDSLKMNARLCQGQPYEKAPVYLLKATAANNTLSTLLNYNNQSGKLPIKGKIDAKTHFYQTDKGPTAHVTVHPSEIMLGNTKWDVEPADIIYQKNNLTIDYLSLTHAGQHIIINGKASKNENDSIVADLKDVDVAYILNLVNFHSVEFAGKASGKAIVKSLFQKPEMYANLDVNEFTFEKGPLGVLHANVIYDNQEGQINIKANADDGPEHMTYIDGYVSPKRNYIDLGINAQGTSLKFMENFCGSFMDNIEAWCHGKLDVVGDLSNINLVGDIVAKGKMHMRQLGTEYHFDNLRAHAIPDDIMLEGDTIYDKEYNGRNSHLAVVRGGIHHKHLTRLSYDLDIEANNFLGFDTHTFGDNTFYGTIYATGNVGIHGKSGETTIDIDATPEPRSTFVYNVTSPDAISDKAFIHWHDVTPFIYRPFSATDEKKDDTKKTDNINLASDMHINFLVNANPNLTLKLLMDEQTGDYITLNGNGMLRANYFNKGGLDMFGNFVVDHGVYKLTIQNIIKKDFEFMPGGTISFGGDPYNAPLNLQAKYTVTGVPLSDLNIGRSFSSNNIRVDCLMGITGTPSSPKVDFSMDLPTVNSDAKQMIYSIINSQEEMNQQVLYLLGIGRFFSPAKNNQASEDATQQSQTSLAMQSLLSGTISQQINNVLSSLVNNSNWNFGANISTGDEGFNNAEYEGLLSGRLLNNRLLFNGQFGYRDNANTTQSFIGDFDLRYLIFPNGNLSIHVYNQANDRYFTRNSLNTQGIGLIMKKDFSSLWDLFGIKKKAKKGKSSSKVQK